jgi:pSer/pThr/pTyr-binding forkhead associated (FHA) protein
MSGPTPGSAPSAPRAVMTLIRPDGSEGGSHNLREGVNKIGRNHGAIFESDGYLSPEHAELIITKPSPMVRDLGSLNGVFVRMTEEEEVQPGQVIRIGQELLRFDLVEPPAPLEDGTEVMGSPNPGYWGRVSVMVSPTRVAAAYPIMEDGVGIGRENGEITFPDDGYVSGSHCRIVGDDEGVFLEDLGSSNGSYLRVRRGQTVQPGTLILIGQQLFRIDPG